MGPIINRIRRNMGLAQIRPVLLLSPTSNGSKVLCSAFQKSEHLLFDDKLFLSKAHHLPRFLDWRLLSRSCKFWVLQLTPNELSLKNKLNIQSLCNWVKENDGVIIYNSCSNKLQQLITDLATKKRNSVHVFGKEENGTIMQVDLDFDAILEHWQHNQNQLDEMENAIKDFDFIEINYERDLTTPEKLQSTLDRISKELRLKLHNDSPLQVRLARIPYAHQIGNWYELLPKIQKHPVLSSYL